MATKPIPREGRQINWTPKVRLSGGDIGRYLGRCEITGKHRVQTYRDTRGRPLADVTGMSSNEYVYTTWLLNDAGQCRGDLAPCDQDYAGQA